MSHYVQYGCGFESPEGWINYDASPTLRFERLPLIGRLYSKNSQRFPANVRYGDIASGLPENENSCDGIFCSHILEHLSYSDFKRALHNTYKMLKPGGIFRCIVPDLNLAISNYLENYNRLENPASEFLRSTHLGLETRNAGFTGIIKDFMGNSRHLWMWDDKSLKHELKNAGFQSIRTCTFNDSADTHFCLVETENRFNGAVAIECIK